MTKTSSTTASTGEPDRPQTPNARSPFRRARNNARLVVGVDPLWLTPTTAARIGAGLPYPRSWAVTASTAGPSQGFEVSEWTRRPKTRTRRSPDSLGRLRLACQAPRAAGLAPSRGGNCPSPLRDRVTLRDTLARPPLLRAARGTGPRTGGHGPGRTDPRPRAVR